MPSISIVAKTSQSPSKFNVAGKPSILRAINAIVGIVSGSVKGSISIQADAADPVAASGSIALTQANLDADDTVTILGVTLTCKASGATGNQFNKGADVTASGANLAALINSQAVISKYLIATNAAGTVTVRSRLKGAVGNYLLQMATSDATAFGLTQLSGGAGGPAGAATFHAR